MTTVLIKPLVGLQVKTRIAETVPRGATVIVSESSSRGWAEISWNGAQFSVFRQDLLDACPVDAVPQISLALFRLRA
jgi:hypothetical protein